MIDRLVARILGLEVRLLACQARLNAQTDSAPRYAVCAACCVRCVDCPASNNWKRRLRRSVR
jgi:hypothetical protein